MPAAGAGTSASTLSVEISTTVSSAPTASPGCLCHSRIVPSVTDSPIWGITMSTVSPVALSVAGAGAWLVATGSPVAALRSWRRPRCRFRRATGVLPWSRSTCSASSSAACWAPRVPGSGSPSSDGASCDVAGTSPLAAISASTAPTATVSPSCAWIFTTRPPCGAGTSASTLSVETSTRVSSAATSSPSALCHSRMVPSVTESPIWGITTSIVVFTAMPAKGIERARGCMQAGTQAGDRARRRVSTTKPAVPANGPTPPDDHDHHRQPEGDRSAPDPDQRQQRQSDPQEPVAPPEERRWPARGRASSPGPEGS